MLCGMSAKPIFLLKLRIFPLDFTCSLLEQLKINVKKYALRTLNGSFLDAKTFNLEIGRIDCGAASDLTETAHDGCALKPRMRMASVGAGAPSM